MTDTTAAFIPQGELLLPTPSTEGGWNKGTLTGRYIAGLVAWGAERHAEPDLQPARLTVDMFRPATIGATDVRTRVVRDGRRIRVIDVDVMVDEVLVCRGSTVFLRRSAEPRGDGSRGEGWLPEEADLPAPETLEPMKPVGWQPKWEQRLHGVWGSIDAARGAWIGEIRPFVEGEETSPFVRAALAADNANGCINATPIGLPYINADLTLTLARLPVGDWIGLVPISRVVADGISVGTIDVYDVKGRVGQTSMIALADERNMPG